MNQLSGPVSIGNVSRRSASVLAAIVTLGVMGLLLWSGVRTSREERGMPREADALGSRAALPQSDADPADPFLGTDTYEGAAARVRSLLDSARDGDVDAYLSAFAGPWRMRLDREVAETGPVAFAEALRSAAATRKSRAVFAPMPVGPDTVHVVVETVYPDRNERQTFRLERDPRRGAWSVTDVEIVRTHQPRAKYGSLATFEGPEGIPVPR